MEQITLRTASGLGFTIGIDPDRHALCLNARDAARGIDLSFEAEDGIDDLGLINVIWGPYNPVQGKKYFFHRASRLFQNADGSAEIRSCPVDAATGLPMAALVAHYRFEVLPGADALRISGWFTRREPCTAGTLHWLNLTAAQGTFDTLQGFEPACRYPLGAVPHALRFPALALTGGNAWAALVDCGEALFTPGKADPYEPQSDALPSFLRPQATTVHQVHLNLYAKASPLTATLVVGCGEVALPALPSPAPVCGPPAQGEAFTLQSGPLALTVLRRADGCSLPPLDTRTWRPMADKVGMAPLLRLLVKHLESGEMQTLSTETGWRRSEIMPFDGGLRIYLSEPEGITDFSLEIEVRADRQGRFTWHTHVLNTNPGWTVLYATYPALNLATAAGMQDDLCLFTPKDCGALIAQPCRRGYHYNGVYPHGVETPMGYMGLYHAGGAERNGLYVGLHDPGGSRKEMTADFSTAGSGCFEFVCIAPNINRGANAFALPGVLVWQVFGGDWYDMACLYRDFVHTQAQWLPAHGRSDSPAWIRDVPFYILDRMPPGDNPDNLGNLRSQALGQDRAPDDWYEKPIRLAKALGLPMGYHLYEWHWAPFDNDYPNYFPVKEGLKEGVRAMHAHGIHVMPYINGRLWDTHDRRGEDWRFTREALAHTSKKEGGVPYTECYHSFEPDGSRVALAVMCPSTWRWREEMLQVTRRLCTEYGMDGVYLDQVSCAAPSPCEDPGHNHTPGNGAWWRESYALLMQRIRAEAPEGCAFTSESNAEIYTDQFDGFLTWTWLNSNLVPAFPLVYGGYVALFGRSADRGGRSDDAFMRYHLAQSLMFGQQLGWINPGVVDNADLLPYLKALATLRYRYRDFFQEGDMLRPPRLVGEMPVLLTDSAMGESLMFEGGLLMAAAWKRRADGRLLLLLANADDKAHSAAFAVPWDEYGVSPEAMRQVAGDGVLEAMASDGLRATLPGGACLVLEGA